MPADQIAWALGIHAVVLPFSLVGLYRYSDRTALFSKSMVNINELLTRMKTRVVASIEEELAPVFERSEGEPTIVGPDGYSERGTNPVGSEALREALRRFVNANVEVIADYGRTSRARTTWFFCARGLSWTVLLLALWEVICLTIFGLVGKLFEIEMSAEWARWSLAPTALLVLAFFVFQVALQWNHDAIYKNWTRYDDL